MVNVVHDFLTVNSHSNDTLVVRKPKYWDFHRSWVLLLVFPPLTRSKMWQHTVTSYILMSCHYPNWHGLMCNEYTQTNGCFNCKEAIKVNGSRQRKSNYVKLDMCFWCSLHQKWTSQKKNTTVGQYIPTFDTAMCTDDIHPKRREHSHDNKHTTSTNAWPLSVKCSM